ncbi:hypothetical protein LCGC14_0701310 [marine sediment metagenome]|uniref:DUF4915 domain-containing protein n=1 Tax=marine sediment metagenome TaxID=412755 RepID=A0A0F9QHP5_9ZZZZ
MKILASSVIRGSNVGEVHGGLYLVDFDNETVKVCVHLDQNFKCLDSLSHLTYGGERGFRGIGFYDERIFVTAAGAIHEFDPEFNLINSYSVRSLQNAHETFVKNDELFISCTAWASILVFNMKYKMFVRGYKINFFDSTVELFDPHDERYELDGKGHINNIFLFNGPLYFSGTQYPYLFRLNYLYSKIERCRKISDETHNVKFLGDHLIYNDTGKNRIVVLGKDDVKPREVYHPPVYTEAEMGGLSEEEGIARQGFTRGLAVDGDLIFGGSSPANVTMYERGNPNPVKTIRISKNICNAIHGLEVWPYDV